MLVDEGERLVTMTFRSAPRVFLPPEDAAAEHPVEVDGRKRCEHSVVVDLAHAHLHVLVYAGRIARRVGDVAQPVGGQMTPGVCKMDVANLVASGLDDRCRVMALVEGVRGAIEE